ncbi:hypothetical protein E2C01_048424 [Portunus trituberculatus]|uniref:Uncharacterized protein n=1 Tax=Portunus trituberculatus TaxID=210409 RepID=A0A5B7GAZ3_PORTR|nr:hypothetical protein [Portunus trituberculatus]
MDGFIDVRKGLWRTMKTPLKNPRSFQYKSLLSVVKVTTQRRFKSKARCVGEIGTPDHRNRGHVTPSLPVSANPGKSVFSIPGTRTLGDVNAGRHAYQHYQHLGTWTLVDTLTNFTAPYLSLHRRSDD